MRNRFGLKMAMLWIVLTLSAAVGPTPVGAADKLPQFLSPKDADTYRQIFALQEDGEIKAAAMLIKTLDSDLLMGHVLSQKYLHPTAWRSSFKDLSVWLSRYNDHPSASRIKWLSDKRKPKGAKSAKAPKQGYLNGVGLSRPQSYRATIPESWKGRSAPRRTANIAREIRRAIRRGHPSGALDIINNKSNLRYLTASEEAHLRGEIAHAYFIFGVDDKAVRAARQAIAKDTEQAFMGYWAGGLASWRAERFELAGSFFRTLAEMENAPDVLRAGAAFWAHRVAMRFGQPLQADSYMNIAATYPETFYGVMAVQAAGQRYEIDFSLPAITDDFRAWLAAQRGGQRALALLQVGNWTRAARELRYLVEEMPPAFQRDLIAFATRNHMPGLAFRLADLHQRDTGEQIYAALYPLLSEATDFVVDEALVLAIIRKESGFYPLARSRARAAGLMQLMPATAAFIAQDRRYRRTHKHKLHDPTLNLHLGQKYIGHLLAEPHINGDLVRMLAAYNGGPGNLNKWLRKLDHKDDSFLLIESIPARETRNYIKGVLSYLFIYRNQLGQPMPSLLDLVAGQKADRRLASSQ